MKIHKITAASEYLGVSINTFKTLARFGYEYLDAIFKNLEITVEVVETKEKKYEEELAEDIMKILTCYSARFYGRRGGRKKKNTVETLTEAINRAQIDKIK